MTDQSRSSRSLLLAFLLLSLTALCHAAAQAQTKRPNIVLIMSDDMGYSDLGCYGGEIHTPNLDRLAKSGVRFTQFYNTARCCPTRASLLTGLYPHQAGVGHMMDDKGFDGYRGELNRSCVTIAEALRPAGYATYMTGKWHLTQATGPNGPKDNWPLQRGFDHYYGTITGAGSYYDPSALVRDNTMLSAYADREYQPRRYYYTDALSEHASRFIRQHREAQAGKPFFMYVAFTAAHWPMHALEEDVAKYRGRYDAGYAAIRAERVTRMKKLGLLNRDWAITPTVGDWTQVKNRDWEARCMEVYAAMVDRMDQGVGRIVQSLKDTGQLENTLILFLQDNGGCAEGIGRTGNTARAARPTLTAMRADELQPKIHPDQTRDGYPVLTGTAVLPGPADTYIAYGQEWANVSNTPFREYKHWVHEGGISTPLIAHWPKGIPERQRSRLVSEPSHLIDIMATCLDAAGAAYPQNHAGHAVTPLEGRSLIPAFRGAAQSNRSEPRGPLFWEHEGNRAVRDGSWKLVARGEKGPWELYAMAGDRTETQDLAAQQPERVKAMAAQWQAWAERSHVLPLNPQKPVAAPSLSTRRRFDLQPGDTLSRAQSPAVAGKSFTLEVEVTTYGEGVLVAQGGVSEGYALYMKAGRAVFAARHAGKLSLVTLPGTVPEGPITLTVNLGVNGMVVLKAGAQSVIGMVPGPLTKMPVDGLQVGQDAGGRVGDYADAFVYTGKIKRVTIQLAP